jgi:hypothetical protein
MDHAFGVANLPFPTDVGISKFALNLANHLGQRRKDSAHLLGPQIDWKGPRDPSELLARSNL